MPAAPTLDYAPAPLVRPPWGPILPRPSRRTILLILLTAATLCWLARRHEPWRHTSIPLSVDSSRVIFTPTGKLLLITPDTAAVFHLASGRPLHQFGESTPELGLAPNHFIAIRGGREIARVYDDHVILYDADTAAEIGSFERPLIGGFAPTPLPMSPPDRRALLLNADSEHPYESVNFGRPVPSRFFTWDLDAPRPDRTAPLPTHSFTSGMTVKLASDGRAIAIRNPTNWNHADLPAVTLFDFTSGRPIPLDPPPPPDANFDGFSADNRWLTLTQPGSGGSWIYATNTGKRLPMLPPPRANSYRTRVEPSPDGRYAATEFHLPGWTDPAIQIYDLAASPAPVPATPVTSRTVAGSNLLYPRFSPDGTRLFARADGAGNFALYDVPTLRTLARLPAPRAGLYEATFSPDGQHLAAPGADGRLHLYSKVGYECRESPLGLLGMPHAWLLILLLTATSFSLRADARHTSDIETPYLPLISTAMLLAALPRTAQLLLSACLDHLLLTPAPLLLLCAIGLATASRFWRTTTIITLAATSALELHCLRQLPRSGPTTLPLLDRTLTLPTTTLMLALLLGALAAVVGIIATACRRA